MKTVLAGGLDKEYPSLVVESTFFTGDNVADWNPASGRSDTLDALPLVSSAG